MHEECLRLAFDSGAFNNLNYEKDLKPLFLKYPIESIFLLDNFPHLKKDKVYCHKLFTSTSFFYDLYKNFVLKLDEACYGPFTPTTNIFQNITVIQFNEIPGALLNNIEATKHGFGFETAITALILAYSQDKSEMELPQPFASRFTIHDKSAYAVRHAITNGTTTSAVKRMIESGANYLQLGNSVFWTAFEECNERILDYMLKNNLAYVDSRANFFLMRSKSPKCTAKLLSKIEHIEDSTISSICSSGNLSLLEHVVIFMEPSQAKLLTSCFIAAYNSRKLNILRYLLNLSNFSESVTFESVDEKFIDLLQILINPVFPTDDISWYIKELEIKRMRKYKLRSLSDSSIEATRSENNNEQDHKITADVFVSLLFSHDFMVEYSIFNLPQFEEYFKLMNYELKNEAFYLTLMERVKQLISSGDLFEENSEQRSLLVNLLVACTSYFVESCDYEMYVKSEKLLKDFKASTNHFRLKWLFESALSACHVIFDDIFEPRVLIDSDDDMKSVFKYAILGSSLHIVERIALHMTTETIQAILNEITANNFYSKISSTILEYFMIEGLWSVPPDDVDTTWLSNKNNYELVELPSVSKAAALPIKRLHSQTSSSTFEPTYFPVFPSSKVAIMAENVPDYLQGLMRNFSTAQDNNSFVYPQSAGERVVVYVMERSIDAKAAGITDGLYEELQRDVSISTTSSSSSSHSSNNNNNINDDSNNNSKHGTRVAAIIAKTCPKAKIVLVPLTAHSLVSEIAVAFSKIKEHYQSNKGSYDFAVINASFMTGYDTIYNRILYDLAASHGIVCVSAAGNGRSDACRNSPASSPYAITVGSITLNTKNTPIKVSSFSNYGKCVDVFAFGEIAEVVPEFREASSDVAERADDSNGIIHGTSMAAPIVTAVLALAASAGLVHDLPSSKAFIKTISTEEAIKDYTLNDAFDSTTPLALHMFPLTLSTTAATAKAAKSKKSKFILEKFN